MEYFHLGISVIPRVYLIKKYGTQIQAFFSYFIDFLTPCVWVHLRVVNLLFQAKIPWQILNYGLIVKISLVFNRLAAWIHRTIDRYIFSNLGIEILILSHFTFSIAIQNFFASIQLLRHVYLFPLKWKR